MRRNRPATIRTGAISKTPSRQAVEVNKPTRKSKPAPPVEWISQFVGLSGDQDPFVLRHCTFNQLNCYKASDWACIRIKGDGEIPLHFTVVPDTHLDARPEFYPRLECEELLIPQGNALLQSYFEVIHTSYPLLDPSRFTGTPRTGDPLIAVMYSLAIPFCQNMPNHLDSLNAYIQQALPIERRYPRLETIEAALLFCQRHTRVHRAPTTPGLWEEVGALVGMSHDLGLNVNPTTWNLSTLDLNRRIRLWWGVYIQDKWSALGLGRPSYLNDEHCNVSMVTLENFSHAGLGGERIGTLAAQQFVAMAELTAILSDLLSTFYTLKAVDRVKCLPTITLYSYMDDFQSRIHEAHERHIRQLYGINTLLDSTGTVFLAYYTLEIVLYRAMLRCLPMNDPSYMTIRSHAKATIMHIISFLQKLQVNRLRAFWWSPMSRINFAIAGGFMFFLLLTSVENVDVEFWSMQIEHYRGLLRLQSISFDATKLASSRMDLLAAGMGVEMVTLHGGIEVEAGFVDDDAVTAGAKIQPGTPEEWIAKQGHESLMRC